ncbi:hypothetical protein SPRG_18817 [Saprolegnia parasitica CBS 223.65]|uniref:Uncharacterized protein n=1 Tax=Saprolegnia parasitica (strain CBS 223.65) TaxID=695850 RepID=A0A067D2E3_SAPPC|nr:hypothetical protein SPRG_18817 [Saprolegnia parasitica CBS 223.65]KDO35655.1 hypothetical protein SPRG_18817 [Saprolegnia parasitica CBS 223.65]|eukprot:XP_012194034.1 hypothetical protein SPRG_18817 [Saprolegnia parasitica CBS 223.65]
MDGRTSCAHGQRVATMPSSHRASSRVCRRTGAGIASALEGAGQPHRGRPRQLGKSCRSGDPKAIPRHGRATCVASSVFGEASCAVDGRSDDAVAALRQRHLKPRDASEGIRCSPFPRDVA